MKHENNYSACRKTQCEVQPDKEYWDTRWKNQETGWNIGYPAPALTNYIDRIADKNTAILIPGCGNAYEAEYLVAQGFTNITLIDIASTAVEKLKNKFQKNQAIAVLCEDFFQHNGKYDLVLEQTFFCAIAPAQRKDYAKKMHEILNHNGRVAGLLFNKQFNKPHPPFGGSLGEYQSIFDPYFEIEKMETCYNSIEPRKGHELFIRLLKK